MPTSHSLRTAIAVLALAVSAVALGQNADANTAAPTKNDYQLRVMEPAQGATIEGSTVRVTVSTDLRGQTTDLTGGTAQMPKPRIQVFLDDQDKGVLSDEQNVLTLENVPAGEHKLVVLAKNASGEVIDREELAFRSSAPSQAAGSSRPSSAPVAESGVTSSAPSEAPAPRSAEPARETAVTAPAGAPAASTEPARPERAPAAETAPPPSPATELAPQVEGSTPETLPATGSPFPAIAAIGLVLLTAGAALRLRS
jgi:hypothetical protein